MQPEWIFMPGRTQLVYKMYIFERPIFNISYFIKPLFLRVTQKAQNDRQQCQMSLSKKLTCYRDFVAGAYLSEAPSPTRFLFGVLKQFCRLERVELLQNMVSNGTPPTPSQPLTVCMTLGRGGGEGVGEVNHRESQKGNSLQSWVENTNMTDSISSLKTLLNNIKDDIQFWCLCS